MWGAARLLAVLLVGLARGGGGRPGRSAAGDGASAGSSAAGGLPTAAAGHAGRARTRS